MCKDCRIVNIPGLVRNYQVVHTNKATLYIILPIQYTKYGPSLPLGAYYFPNYHPDPRNEQLYGKGWTEWELLKDATPRFDGHQQPKAPA
jgi:hypothetical protein